MSTYFAGGPADGQVSGGPPPGMPPGMMGEEPPAEAESEGVIFQRLLADCRAALALRTVGEQNKLLISKAESLLSQVAANEEKDDEAAMGGKLTPGVMRKLGAGGGGAY